LLAIIPDGSFQPIRRLNEKKNLMGLTFLVAIISGKNT
jgi:hypothetical protein